MYKVWAHLKFYKEYVGAISDLDVHFVRFNVNM